MILKARHFFDAGICMSGVEARCQDLGIDFREFIMNGMDETEVEKYLPDAYIERALEEMRRGGNG